MTKTLGNCKWTVIKTHRGVPMIVGEGVDDGGHIARVGSTSDRRDEFANLLAAAPDLLAACKAAESALGGCSDTREIVRAAIAKAEGH